MQASGLRSQKRYSYVTLTKCHSDLTIWLGSLKL